MRELFAVRLEPHAPDGSDAADVVSRLLAEWATNPYADVLAVEDLLSGGEHEPAPAASIRTEVVSTDAAKGFLLDWRFADRGDESLQWHIAAAVGREAGSALVVTLRVGIEQRAEQYRVNRATYEFRTPTIVRTLLREFECSDGLRRLQPDPDRLRAGQVTELVDHLVSPDRRLPVVILTPDPQSGRPLADDVRLAREMAGIASVVTLTTHLATRALTDELAPTRSVWNGAIRIYWPGFQRDSDPREHRLWFADRLKASGIPIEDELRRWVGTLAALNIPDHPIVSALRRQRVADIADEATPEVAEWVAALEEMVEAAERDKRELEATLTDRENTIASMREDLAAKERAFKDMALALGAEGADDAEAAAAPITTVEDAIGRFLNEVGTDAIVLEEAIEGAVAFRGYNEPEKMYRALVDIAEVSRKYGDNTLGESFSQFFQARGWVYKHRNPVANDRRYKAHYQRSYKGERVVMEAHLAVDVGTTRDQCLRIYWYLDEEERVFVLGHIGHHLPDSTT